MAALLEAALSRRPAALGRLLSVVEEGGERAREVSGAVFGAGSGAASVAVTGAPGAGKSTLTAALLGRLRSRGVRTAVLAIDPSSPFSGGALLGDRVRMLEHTRDPNVFIRSMATRGSKGGLATAAPDAIRLLDAAGFDWIVLETAGVGQVEVDAAAVVDTTVVVLNPGWGDDVQAAKAGVMEIADVFVINKADRHGVEKTRRHIAKIVSIRADGEGWTPPIVATVAPEGRGLEELVAAIEEHRTWLERSENIQLRRNRHLWGEVEHVVGLRLSERVQELVSAGALDPIREQLAARKLDPWAAADLVMARIADSSEHGR